jgi:hypothetical protein
MEWDEHGAAVIQLGEVQRRFAALLVSLEASGQTPVRLGLAIMFAGWRDRKHRLDGHFDRLEREAIKNEEE